MERGRELGSRRKTYPQTPLSARKSVNSMTSIVDTKPVCSSAPKPSEVFSGSHTDHQNVDLKQINTFISSVKMALFRISRELHFGVCNHGESCASSYTARNNFRRGEKEVGRALLNRAHGFLLAESLPGKKRIFSSSCLALLLSQDIRALSSGHLTLFS